MGQAKQRGTYEERKAAAIERDNTLLQKARAAFRRPEPTTVIASRRQSPRRKAILTPLIAAMCGMGSPYGSPGSKIAPMSKSTSVRARRKAAKQGRGR